MRQFPSRYAFRALRNLPEKELRYLRTVIVTADIDEGFGRSAATRLHTLIHTDVDTDIHRYRIRVNPLS